MLEESIKELEQEEEERKREENNTSNESTDVSEAEGWLHSLGLCYHKVRIISFTRTSKHLQATDGDSKNAKKKNNKKTSKNKSGLSRANKKKPGMPNVSNDLSQKLYATMEKHKEVRFTCNVAFLVVQIHRETQETLQGNVHTADDFHFMCGHEPQRSPPGGLSVTLSSRREKKRLVLLFMLLLFWSLPYFTPTLVFALNGCGSFYIIVTWLDIKLDIQVLLSMAQPASLRCSQLTTWLSSARLPHPDSGEESRNQSATLQLGWNCVVWTGFR